MSQNHSANYGVTEAELEQLRQRAIRFAREECPAEFCPIESELIRCVDESVNAAAQNTRISTHIPILAMKRVRECIQAGTCNLESHEA